LIERKEDRVILGNKHDGPGIESLEALVFISTPPGKGGSHPARALRRARIAAVET
jgi:hypothetical protein